MKTLFINYSYLFGNGGGINASRAYINAFAEISEEMTLVFSAKHSVSPSGINFSKICLYPIYDCRSIVKKGISYVFGAVNRFEHLSESFFDSKRFDVVIFNNSTCSFRLVEKFNKAGIKTITIHHNYQIEYVKGDFSPLLKLPMLYWTSRFEGRASRNSTLNLTLTAQDAEAISRIYKSKAPFEVIGVFDAKRSEVELLKFKMERKHRFTITGGLSDKQTEDSLMQWIEVYYPILKQIVPDAILTIAGKSPSKVLSNYILSQGIILIPSPESMQPILQNADYYINPIDRGGGLKLRNMDGLKNGLPVLAHLVSARGYEKFVQKDYVFSYFNIESFKNSIKAMLHSNSSRQDIIKQYNSEFSFESSLHRLLNILRKYEILTNK